jgi:2-hydroxycyclohexanecarboxyl-CoA dehydrogenase
MKTIALEYGRYGVRANLVAPGLVLPDEEEELGTESIWRDRNSIMNDAQTEYVVRNTPLRRLSRPQDIANSVLFLASDETGRQLTGQMLTVSGGFAMR